MYGWRAKLGVLLPAIVTPAERDFYSIVPEGVTCHFQRFPFAGGTEIDVLKGLEKFVPDAAELVSYTSPTVIGMVCTAGSFVGGLGYDQKIIEAISKRCKGVPATTASTSAVVALKKLGVKNISLATPYSEELANIEKKFLEDGGFQVLGLSWLNKFGGFEEVSHIPYEVVYRLVKEAFKPKSEAIFVTCVGLHVVEIIEKLEQDWKIPVISSVQATAWNMLRMANVNEEIEGYGRLLHL